MDDGGLFSMNGARTVVTGAASGLGQAIAAGFAGRGAHVVAVDLDPAGAEATVAAIRQRGGTGHAFQADLSDPAAIQELFGFVASTWGSLDVLVNNAGISVKGEPETLELEVWERVLRVNTTSYLLTSQAAFPLMRAGTGGSIINVSSIAGVSAQGRGSVAYSVSKAAVNQLTRELAVEWGAFGIRVNAVLPCQFMTPALASYLDSAPGQGILDLWLKGIPLGRLGEVAEIVGPVVFLASAASAMVTGHLLAVDGGNLATNASGTVRPLAE